MGTNWLRGGHANWTKPSKSSASILSGTAVAAENGRWHPEVVIRRMLFRPWKSGVGWRVLFTVDEIRQVVTVLQVRHEHRPLLEEGEA